MKRNAKTWARQLRRRPFSLMEVMVVLVIIGMIIGLVGPNVVKRLERAKRDTAKTQLKLLAECVETFHLDMNEYPSSLSELVQDPGAAKWDGPYVKDGHLPKDPWGNDYVFSSPGSDGRAYDIVCYGADGAPGGEGKNEDVGHWTKEEDE